MNEPKLSMAELKKIVRELCHETKAQLGRQVSARGVVEAQAERLPQQFLAGAERWIALDESGPAVGERAPDFLLNRPGLNEDVRLSVFTGQRPVDLAIGSYTSPTFREQARQLEEVYQGLRGGLEFFLVYTKEMHAVDGVQAQANVEEGVLYRQRQGLEERGEVAAAYRRNLSVSMPVLLDDMDDQCDGAYAASPGRLYAIDSEGKVAYRGGGGPHLYDPGEWGEAIEACLSREKVSSRS